MKKKSTIKSIIQVTLSNITTILSGILVGFLLPKMISVDDYGYYKTFTLYASYAELFSIGMIDGIVLAFGGKNYEHLNKEYFRSYFKWYFLIHCIFVVALFSGGMFFLDSEYGLIITFLGVYLLANNITGYFQQLSQITQRFKEYSVRKILQSTLNVLAVVSLFVMYKFHIDINYRMYLSIWLVINIILTLWYVFTYRDIIFGQSCSMKETRNDMSGFIKNGIPLLIANLCSSLILTLDRQFVNVLFDKTTYAVYAFAYNMLALVTVATSAVSSVLYPTMKRMDENDLKKNYGLLIGVILLFVNAALIVYFPLSLFVKAYLPKYTDSLVIFQIIFPGLTISSAITVVMHNYYKVFEASFKYFKKSIVVLIVSFAANLASYAIWKTTISISIASIATMVVWYIYVENYFVKEYQYKRWKNLGYILAMLGVFYLISAIRNEWIGACIYLVVYLAFSFVFYKKDIKILSKLFNKSKK